MRRKKRPCSWRGARRAFFTLLLLLAGLAPRPVTVAQVNVGGEASNFIVPNTDEQGRKTVVKGGKAKTLPNGLVELTALVIEVYRNERDLDMLIEAPLCVYDDNARVVDSTGPLAVKTVDGRFQLKGRGFRWQQANAQLVVSNDVQAVIRKALLEQGRPLTEPANKPSDETSKEASSSSSTNLVETIDIESGSFQFQPQLALFRQDVIVRQRSSELACGLLRVEFAGEDGAVQNIDAEQNVRFRQDEVETESQRARYSISDEVIILTGQPRWKIGAREGSGESIRINNRTRNFRVERNVQVRLPVDQLLPLEWLTANEPKTNRPAAGAPLAISAGMLDYAEEAALFSGQVKAVDAQGSELYCDELLNTFDPESNELRQVRARGTVRLQRGETVFHAQEASYTSDNELIILTGNPRWTVAQGEGRGDRVIFDPQRQEMRAQGNVCMTLKDAPVSLSLELAPAASENESPEPQKTELMICSSQLVAKNRSAIFVDRVKVTYPADPGRSLASEVLAAFFSSENQVEYLVAEDQVDILQTNLHASGGKAVYRVPQGIIELSQDPLLRSPGRTLSAERFILDQTGNTFRMVGRYRVSIDQTTLNEARSQRESPQE